jgi:hypothetical protein
MMPTVTNAVPSLVWAVISASVADRAPYGPRNDHEERKEDAGQTRQSGELDGCGQFSA